MRAQSTKAARPAAIAGPPAAGLVVAAGALALWTAVVAIDKLDPQRLALGGGMRSAIVYGLPALLAAVIVFDARAAEVRALRWAAGWCALVVVAQVAADKVSVSSTAVLALPALALAAFVLGRRPAIGVVAVMAISGFYGSLIAFWKFPEEKAVQLALGALTLALLWRVLISGRDHAFRFTLGLALPLFYAYVTLVQTILDAHSVAAGRGFMTSTWFILAFAVIALSGWSPRVHEQIAKGVVLVAGAVGAYALYRWLAGISVSEYNHWASDRYNYVGGELRLLGSFPTGQDLGGWTSIVAPFCVAVALTFHGRWRLAGFGAAALCVFALAASQVRIAVVAVALGCLTVIALHELSRGFAGRRLGATAAGLLVMVALGVAAFQVTGGTTDRATHSYTTLIHPLDRNDPSVDARLYKWEVALREMRDHPFGYGIGTANKQATGLLSSSQSIGQFDVDNGFLRVGLEQGFAVMVLFGAAMILLAIDLTRRAITLPERMPAGIVIGAAGMMVAFLVTEWAVAFQDGPRALPVWVIAGLGLAQFTTVRGAGATRGNS
jgi:hypothetical protein